MPAAEVTLLWPSEKHFILIFQLAALQLSGQKRKVATAKLLTCGSIPQLDNALLCSWESTLHLLLHNEAKHLPVVVAQFY